MENESLNDRSNFRKRPGIVLLVTIVLLIVLATLGYTISARVAAQRHRDQYIIDYQKAHYACDSAIKFALATLQDINTPQYVARPNEPDFSDLFALSEVAYEELLAEWVAETALDTRESPYDINDINDFNNANNIGGVTDFNGPDSLIVRGPYGPPWPYITEPLEFETGSATVRIEIEDENAKYPLGWALLSDKNAQREVMAGFDTFCEWMDVNDLYVGSIKQGLEEISEIKPFKLKFKPIRTKERKIVTVPRRRRRGRRRTRRVSRTVVKTIPVSEQVARQTKDFAKLFHSSLIDTELLARPTIISDTRNESALKYIGMWGSRKVNINTAPRHVLETAFVFGGDEVEIAEEIIQRRRVKPFKNIEELKKSLLRYSVSIEKCKNYITTASTFFTIKVTAISGVAKASAVIAITKDGKKLKRIAVISD